MTLLHLTALWAFALLAPAEADCGPIRVTGYSRHEFSPRTADGTSIYADEPIAAASWNVPLNSYVEIEGVGTFRIADRGMLGNGSPLTWVDVAVWSRAEAYALTGVRHACIYPPGTAP
jgi:3D (Asp-Asp-Asp) domain-containing protein